MPNDSGTDPAEFYLFNLFLFMETLVSAVALFVIPAVSVGVCFACCWFAFLLRDYDPLNPPIFLWIVVSLFTVWFSTGLFFAQQGISGGGFFLIFGPLVLGTLLTFAWPDLKRLLTVMPMHWLIGVQVYRVAGAIFLLYYFQDGLLSRGFAFNAGFGDVLTGLLAVPVAGAVKRRVRHHRAYALAWNLFGILDLIVAPASAVYFGAKGLGTFPLLMIPLFLGPPLGTLLHICSLRNLTLSQREATVARVPNPAMG